MSLYARRIWVAQAASTLSDKIHHWAKTLPKEDYWTTGIQVVRSADGIPANIVEGFGRRHRKDTLRFYSMAFGSMEETIQWIRRAHIRGLMSAIQASDLVNSYLKLDQSLKKFAHCFELPEDRRSRPHRFSRK